MWEHEIYENNFEKKSHYQDNQIFSLEYNRITLFFFFLDHVNFMPDIPLLNSGEAGKSMYFFIYLFCHLLPTWRFLFA